MEKIKKFIIKMIFNKNLNKKQKNCEIILYKRVIMIAIIVVINVNRSKLPQNILRNTYKRKKSGIESSVEI